MLNVVKPAIASALFHYEGGSPLETETSTNTTMAITREAAVSNLDTIFSARPVPEWNAKRWEWYVVVDSTSSSRE